MFNWPTDKIDHMEIWNVDNFTRWFKSPDNPHREEFNRKALLKNEHVEEYLKSNGIIKDTWNGSIGFHVRIAMFTFEIKRNWND